jgi:predicted MFS family arabinose efflux permease
LRAFAVFLLAYVLSQFYRSFLAVIAPELMRAHGLSEQALANMSAAWILGFVVMQLPTGWALDTLGPKRTVSASMLFAVAGALVFSQSATALSFNIAMALIGIGCGAIYMGALYVFGRGFRPERFAFLSSWLIGLGSAGNLLAATPLAWAAENFGWRPAMLAMAAATAIAAVVVFLAVRDPPRLAGAGGGASAFAAVAHILAIRKLWPVFPLTFLSYAVILAERGLWAGPYFADVHGLDPVPRGNALLIMAAAMAAGALIYGPLDQWLGTRKWIVAAGTAITAALFLVLAFGAPGLTQAVAVMALTGGFGMTYGVLMAHGRGFIPDHLLGRGITIMNILFIGGAGVLQPLSGALLGRMTAGGASAATAYAALHAVFGALLLLGLAIYLFSEDRRR